MKVPISALAGILVVSAACAPAASPSTPTTTNNPAATSAPAATGTTASTGGSTSGEKRSANQVLHYAVQNLPQSYSIEATDLSREQFFLIYDPVVMQDADHNVLPWAATKWDLVNPTTWRLTFRKDLTFSNGDKLTADDVVFTANWVLENKTSPISQFRALQEAKKVDDYTVDFVSKTNDVSTLVGLSFLPIMPQKYFESVGRQGFALKPIGSGPYVLVDHAPNDHAVFKLRPEPHPFRKPILKEIDVKAVPEASAMIAGLKTGDIDFAGRSFSSDQINSLEKDGFVIETPPKLGGGLFVLFPQTETEQRNLPTNNLKVRQALNYAIDREAIAKSFYGGRAKPTGQLVGAGPFYNPDIKPYPYDPAKAKQLLAEAGYLNGFTLQNPLDFSQAFVTQDVIVAIQGYLKEVGVNVEIRLQEQAVYVEAFRGQRAKGDLYASSLYDPNGFDSTIATYFGCDSIYNDLGNVWYCNKEFDQLHAQANTEPDMAKRTALLNKAAKIITDDARCIFVVLTPSYKVHSKKMKGFVWGDDRVWTMDGVYMVD